MQISWNQRGTRVGRNDDDFDVYQKELWSNDLSLLKGVELSVEIFTETSFYEISQKYNVSDDFLKEWNQNLRRYLHFFKELNLFVGKKEEAFYLEKWLEESTKKTSFFNKLSQVSQLIY